MKLRTQQIIANETRVADVIEPLAGSYYVESLTADIEEGAKKFMNEIEEMGGFMKSLEDGFFLN